MLAKITRSLYRHKVRECIRIGYIPGNWNEKYVVKKPYLNKKKITRLHRRGELGDYILNNVRHHYKNSVIEFENCDENEKEELINEGFSCLRAINEVSHRIQYQTMGILS